MKKLLLVVFILSLIVTSAFADKIKYTCTDMNGAYFADAVYHPGTKMAYVYNPEGHYQGYVSFSSEPYTYYTYTAKGALTVGGESISGPETELRAIAYVYIKDKTLQFKFIEQEDIISP